MKKSAMVRAFKVLGEKPILLLLLLPINLIRLLSIAFLQDASKLLDINNMMNNPDSMMATAQSSNILSSLVSMVVLLISLVCLFLLIPPAIELMRSTLSGEKAQGGWYLKGVRNHWWKPFVSGAITEGIEVVIFIPFMIIMFVVLMVVIAPIMQANIPSIDSSFLPSPADTLDGIMSGIMPAMIIVGVVFGLIIEFIMLVVSSILGLLLPALSDRGFGEAFKLMFSKQGFRKVPKMFGGLLLISLVPGLFYASLAAIYLMLTGIPSGYMGFLSAIIGFMKSWEGILSMLLVYICMSITYPFKFSVYQQVKEDEAALVKQ